jgi:hypothetical protein
MTIFTTLPLNEKLKDRGIFTNDEYVNSRSKMKFHCLCGYEWISTPNNLRKCKECSRKQRTSPLSKVISDLQSKKN